MWQHAISHSDLGQVPTEMSERTVLREVLKELNSYEAELKGWRRELDVQHRQRGELAKVPPPRDLGCFVPVYPSPAGHAALATQQEHVFL